MKNIFTLFLLTISVLALAQTDSTKTSTEAEPSKDATTTLPDMTLKSIDGEEVNLMDYGTNEKLTIISFWATWCKPCIKELKNVNELMEDWEDDYNVEVVAISVDDSRNTARVKPMVSGLGWDFEVLLDPNGDVQRAMNVANPPVTFLVDQLGNIVYTHTGYVEGDEYELEEHMKELVE
ncbi:MAG: TlpA family protein disulfide reductase [Bacteroidia bacterium]|nr:TlpA family protein disulfide reductase [Bacteroidia bacterium]NNJ56539.1 TlpA family protein disulfide reductase [Bacteroidia bacterium]